MFSNKACSSLELLEYYYSEQRQRLMLLSRTSKVKMNISLAVHRKNFKDIIIKVGETEIRNGPLTCKLIVGYDCNALWTI